MNDTELPVVTQDDGGPSHNGGGNTGGSGSGEGTGGGSTGGGTTTGGGSPVVPATPEGDSTPLTTEETLADLIRKGAFGGTGATNPPSVIPVATSKVSPLVIVAVLAVGGLAYYFYTKKKPNSEGTK